MEPLVDSGPAGELCRRGLFRGAGGLDVLSGFGRVFSSVTEPLEDYTMFQRMEEVDRVDIFISHSWEAGRWVKYLAMCSFLNLRLAKASTAAVLLFSWCLLLLYPDTPPSLVFLLALDVPILTFLGAFFFGQHVTGGVFSPRLWLDKLCVNQHSDIDKAAGLEGLPTFVASSDCMLVLWDETYFERLWCSYEVAVFVKCRGVKPLRFVPMWLPTWILTGVLLSYVVWRLIAAVQELDPEYGITDTAKYARMDGSMVAYGIQRMLQVVSDLEVYAVLEIPFYIVAVVLLRRKLAGHRSMLENMASFDIKAAKCSLDSDRHVIERQVAELYDGLSEPIITIPIEASDWQREVSIESSGASLSPEERCALRAVVPDFTRGDRLQVFNDHVRFPLRAAIVDDLGSETDLPWLDCVLVYMPAVLAATAVTWASRHLYDKLGFECVGQYLAVNLTQIALAPFCNPLAYSCLLRAMNLLPSWVKPGPSFGAASLACGLLAKIFVCAIYGLACGSFESYALTRHPLFLLGFLTCLALIAMLNWILFSSCWRGRLNSVRWLRRCHSLA